MVHGTWVLSIYMVPLFWLNHMYFCRTWTLEPVRYSPFLSLFSLYTKSPQLSILSNHEPDVNCMRPLPLHFGRSKQELKVNCTHALKGSILGFAKTSSNSKPCLCLELKKGEDPWMAIKSSFLYQLISLSPQLDTNFLHWNKGIEYAIIYVTSLSE